MKKFKIINFQDLKISNAEISKKPFDETKFEDEETLTVVIIRDPYEYFSYLLSDYIQNRMSPKLSKETMKNMKKMDTDTFLEWFKTLHYLPLINPQTFQLDLRKRVDVAIENLESFDYVVPYEEIDIFLEHVGSDVKIHKIQTEELPFSLSDIRNSEVVTSFLLKDIVIYRKIQILWKIIIDNNYHQLEHVQEKKIQPKGTTDSDYIGLLGKINKNTVEGWIYNKMYIKEPVMLKVYQNGIFLENILADKQRKDIQKLHNHPNGLCGFQLSLLTSTFHQGDDIEIFTPNGEKLSLGTNAKSFLKF